MTTPHGTCYHDHLYYDVVGGQSIVRCLQCHDTLNSNTLFPSSSLQLTTGDTVSGTDFTDHSTMRFTKLTPETEEVFRKAARGCYTPFTAIDGMWHPIYQDECVKMNTEHATFVEENDDASE